MTRVVLIGAGGHAAVLLDVARARNDIEVIGYVDSLPTALSSAGLRHLGGDDCAAALRGQGVEHAILGIGGVTGNERRTRLFESWAVHGFHFISLIHPSAVASPRAGYGEGLQCMALAVINAGASLGTNVIVNTGAIVEHDCIVEDHAHVAPGAVVCGGARVGRGALVGAGATVVPGVTIGAAALIAAGSVVTRDVAPGSAVAGVPARPIARSTQSTVRA